MKNLSLLLFLTVAFSANAMDNELKKIKKGINKEILLLEDNRRVERTCGVRYDCSTNTIVATECLQVLNSDHFQRTSVTKHLVEKPFFSVTLQSHFDRIDLCYDEHAFNLEENSLVSTHLKELIVKFELAKSKQLKELRALYELAESKK